MSRTLTVRLSIEQAAWLKATSRKTGLAQSRLLREQIEQARQADGQGFLRLAGTASGPRNLSSRKGFARS